MDYWCALWFWPIEKADLLPSRAEFLLDLSLLLEGNVYDTGPAVGEQFSMFPDTMPQQMALALKDEFGFVDVDRLCRENPRLKLVQELVEKHHFLHWELEFADIFTDRGGFDLVLGNPPWIKVEWNEGGIIGDAEPLYVLRKYTASSLVRLRGESLSRYRLHRVQFPVLHQYEQDTWYDCNGRIVFTVNRGLPGVGFSRPEWEQIKHMQRGTVERKVIDDTLPGGPRERTIVYEAPFDHCDREQDYEIVWAEFERRLGGKRAVA
jgi:hypothetical protein